MKTSLEIDKDKVKLAKQMTSIVTLKELVDTALDSLIAEKRREKMKNLVNKNPVDAFYKLERK